jgi:hypothetical protein
MIAKQLVIGAVVGAATLSASGYLIFWLALGDFYAHALTAGTATGVPRQSPVAWAIMLGALSYGVLLTLAIRSRRDHPPVRTGIVVGAIVGFLVWCTADFMLYGISNVLDLSSALIDPLIEVVPSAIAGGAIAVALQRIR